MNNNLNEKSIRYINEANGDIKMLAGCVLDTLLEVKIENDAYNTITKEYFEAFNLFMVRCKLVLKTETALMKEMNTQFKELKVLHDKWKSQKKVVRCGSPKHKEVIEIYKKVSYICAIRQYLMKFVY